MKLQTEIIKPDKLICSEELLFNKGELNNKINTAIQTVAEDNLRSSIANVLRNSEDHDLPDKSTLGNTRSDIFGLLKYKPSSFFDLEYEFALDKNLNNVLDKNFIGIPVEQYGFSSKEKIRFRKPKFDEGSIEFFKNTILNIELH